MYSKATRYIRPYGQPNFRLRKMELMDHYSSLVFLTVMAAWAMTPLGSKPQGYRRAWP